VIIASTRWPLRVKIRERDGMVSRSSGLPAAWQAEQASARLSTSSPCSARLVEKVTRPSLLSIRTCSIPCSRPIMSIVR
jgi:hypothetical protein